MNNTHDESSHITGLEFQMSALKEEQEKYQIKLQQIKQEILAKRGEIFTAKSGIKPGDIIEVEGERFQYTRIDGGYCKCIHGYKIKKNGIPGKREQIIWGYEYPK